MPTSRIGWTRQRESIKTVSDRYQQSVVNHLQKPSVNGGMPLKNPGFTITELLLVLTLIGVLLGNLNAGTERVRSDTQAQSICSDAPEPTHIRARYGDNGSDNVPCSL